MVRSLLTDAVWKTLRYHSKFNYPLTLDELHRFLLTNRPVSRNKLRSEVIKLIRHRELRRRRSVAISSGLLAMTGNEKFFDLRLKRHQVSFPKLCLAGRAARLIGFLPWVKLVCITGSLAMENSDEDDDIDLMIVTSQNRLWLARPLVVFLVSLFFKRRKPVFKGPTLPRQGRTLSDAICLNLWLDTSALAMPPYRRDSRTAHELAQMKPVVNKDRTYEKMMRLNKWGEKYLANVWSDDSLKHKNFRAFMFSCFNVLMKLNSLLFRLQFAYMKPKITSEEVTLHSAFFHPQKRY